MSHREKKSPIDALAVLIFALVVVVVVDAGLSGRGSLDLTVDRVWMSIVTA